MNCLGGYDVILVKQVWRSPGSRACNLPGKWKFLCAIHFHTVWTDEINRAKTVLLISSAEYSSNYLYSKNRYRYPNIWKPVVQNKICPNLFTILILWFYETSWYGNRPERNPPRRISKKKKSPRSLVGYYPACREAKRAATWIEDHPSWMLLAGGTLSRCPNFEAISTSAGLLRPTMIQMHDSCNWRSFLHATGWIRGWWFVEA